MTCRLPWITTVATVGFLALGGPLDASAAESRASTATHHRDLDIIVSALEVDGPEIGQPRFEYVVSVRQPPGDPIERRGAMSGPLVKSWATDLDADGLFEVILWAQAPGSGSYGELIFMEWTGRDLEVRGLPDVDAANRFGYLGHDGFEVLDRTVSRTFPVYKAGDANCCPSGGRATLIYEYAAEEIRLVSASVVP